MKQIAQNYKSGELAVLDVPAPVCRPGGVLVRTLFSLISTGTEMMKVSEASMSMVGMARARPDQVRKVIDQVQQQGVVTTYKKVMNKLDSYTPLGYSLCGVVTEVGRGAEEFKVGQLVACAGNEQALHADYNWVPVNLCAAVPAGGAARARRVRDRGVDRDARRAAGRGSAGRDGRRHRPRPDRPARRPAAGGGGRAGGRHRPGPGPLPPGGEGRRGGLRVARRPRQRTGRARPDHQRSRRRPRVPLGRRFDQRAGRGGGEAGQGPCTGDRHRQDEAGPAVERLLHEGARRPVLPVIRARAGTTPATSSTASTTRPATSAGPRSGTWSRSSTWSRGTSSRWARSSTASSRWRRRPRSTTTSSRAS